MTENKKLHPDHEARMKMLNDHQYTIETVHGVKQDVVFSSYPEGMEVEEQLDLYTLIDKVIGC